ncbi:MAG: B12-binding domain/radical SAM domain protein [Chloroflexi bacterium B3_Chlor]|nr:MAG: B12-binding domain/radical SAM domain protein [Chloroflexi bacterium B3_Chlor]
MSKLDLVILHPPSVYDFRRELKLYGPVSEVVPSTPIFEMYPFGFATIASYLQQEGFRTRIVNLGLRMMNDPSFDAERFITSLRPVAFGIGLHWLCHAQGALETAKLVKREHPHVPVIMGGFSSSYYHEELMEYPEVDYVLRGDSTEAPLAQLLACLKGGGEPDEVPNLTWRDGEGSLKANPLSHVPDTVDLRPIDQGFMVRTVLRDRDLTGYMPFRDWLEFPMGAGITCRGCTHNCVTCGGSAYAFNRFLGREKPAFRPPEALAGDIRDMRGFGKGLLMVIGDIRQAGRDYARRFLDAVAVLRNPITLELFSPASKDFLQHVAAAMPNFSLEISLESHDPVVRRAFGKHYSNEAVERTIDAAFSAGCKRLDIYFMIGLPKQTRQSVRDTVAYCGELLDRYGKDGRLHPFISPLAPFLDPGSLAFEEPERYGYRIFYRTLEEHRRALLQPSWQYVLNYETEWMTREDIVLSSYEASLELNRIKASHGLMSPEEVAQQEQRTRNALELLEALDDLAEGDQEKLEELRPQLDEINAIVARPKNDWELGLGLGKWGLLRKGYFLVSQGLAAFFNQLRTAMAGRRVSQRRGERVASPSGGQE